MEEEDKKGKGGEEVKKDTPPLQIDPKWCIRYLHRFDHMPLNGRSFQDALRTFFQPIKNDDARLDFYTVYKKEAVEYGKLCIACFREPSNPFL